MILPVKCLRKVYHTGQDCSGAPAVLVSQDKIYKLYQVVGNAVPLHAPILPEVYLITYKLQQPHDNKVFCHFAKKMLSKKLV